MESGLEEVLRPWSVHFHLSHASLADGGVRLRFPARCPIDFGGATLQLWVVWVVSGPTNSVAAGSCRSALAEFPPAVVTKFWTAVGH